MRRLLCALLGLSVALASPLALGEEAATFGRQAIVLTRALAYDSSLASRSGDSFVVVVLAKKGNAASERMSEEVVRVFKPLEAVKIAGLPFRAVAAPFSGVAPLEALIDKEGVDAVFLCEGLAADLPAIKQLSRRRRVLTLGMVLAQVLAGVSLAVVSDNGKLQVVVNLTESREEGAAFGSDLLRIARVVR